MVHINLLWRERTVFVLLYSIYQSPLHPLGSFFWSLDPLAHINCLWLSLHVCTFTASFLQLTVALLFSRMACDTHLSQGNLCILSCQVKQSNNPLNIADVQPNIFGIIRNGWFFFCLFWFFWGVGGVVFFLHLYVKTWPKFQVLNH